MRKWTRRTVIAALIVLGFFGWLFDWTGVQPYGGTDGGSTASEG